MSFEYASGVAYTNLADFLEDVADGLHARMLAAGWSSHNILDATSGQTNRVFKSVGEAGDEIIFVRLFQTSVTNLRIFIGSYYPSAGALVGSEENEVGAVNYSDQYCANAAVQGWIVVDKDFCTFTLKQGGYYGTYGFGTLTRIQPTQWSARTTLNGAQSVAAAGNTTLAVASYDVTKLTAGQKLFVVNHGSVNKGTIVRCTVVTVTNDTHIEVSNDSGTLTAFDDAALVGLNPMPTMILGRCYDTGGSCLRGCTWYAGAFLYRSTTTRMTGVAQATPVNMSGLLNVAQGNQTSDTGLARSYLTGMSPAARGEFVVAPMVFGGFFDLNGNPIASSDQILGYIERVAMITYGVTVSAEDILTDGATTWLAITDEKGKVSYSGSGLSFVALRTVA